jgi:uracil-DNA glycosylase
MSPRDDRALPVLLAEHLDRLSACRRCTDLLQPEVRPVLSRAAMPRVMLVGQAPGKTEISAQTPFAGRAGKTLFRWLEIAGIDEATFREQVYIAAVTRCYPGPSPSGRGDRVPSPAERHRCGAWLDDELRLIRPALLLPVGRLAIERFLPAQPLDALVGRAHRVTHAGGESVAIPLPHPSGASSWIHQGDHPALLARALRLVGEELREVGVLPGGRSRKRRVA